MREEIIQKIRRGLDLPTGQRILHTSPHHDDEMLAYHPLIPKLLKENENIFSYFSTGIHSVADGSKEEKILTREKEAEKMLGQLGVEKKNIEHLRLPFYDDPNTSFKEDIEITARFFERIKPTIITVAVDPKGVGPVTHAKVLQIIGEALRLVSFQPIIWGYRNVWSRFTLEETTLIYPVSDRELEEMNKAFISCYLSQTQAPFSKIAESIQREQYEEVKSILGEEYFSNHPFEAVREAKGFIFINEK